MQIHAHDRPGTVLISALAMRLAFNVPFVLAETVRACNHCLDYNNAYELAAHRCHESF